MGLTGHFWLEAFHTAGVRQWLDLTQEWAGAATGERGISLSSGSLRVFLCGLSLWASLAFLTAWWL